MIDHGGGVALLSFESVELCDKTDLDDFVEGGAAAGEEVAGAGDGGEAAAADVGAAADAGVAADAAGVPFEGTEGTWTLSPPGVRAAWLHMPTAWLPDALPRMLT